MLRRLAPLALLIALAVGGAGCAADPVVSEPSPRFTTDADAFAAAEETYRAYVDALNEVDLSDPETFEAVYAWTTGDANADERKNLSRMHAQGWAVRGRTQLISLDGITADEVRVDATACVDVATIVLVDDAGRSVVSAGRPDVYGLELGLTFSNRSPTGLLVSTSTAVADSTCVS